MKFHHHFHYRRHYVGVFLLLISLTPFFIPNELKRASILTVYYGCYCTGIILISDYINFKITGSSLLSQILHKGKPRTYFFIIGMVSGLMLDAFSTYLGGLWYYPYYSTLTYLSIVIFLGGFAWYFLTIVMSYEAIKDILDKVIPGKKNLAKALPGEYYFYPFLAVIGVAGLSATLGQIFYRVVWASYFIFDINKPKTPYINFREIMFIFLFSWLILEYIEFRRKRTSLIKDMLLGYVNPVLAIVIVCIILGLYMELQNVPIKLWVYTNWPWANFTFFGIPLTVWAVGWPIHYIFYLSLYRALGDSKTTKAIWNPTKAK